MPEYPVQYPPSGLPWGQQQPYPATVQYPPSADVMQTEPPSSQAGASLPAAIGIQPRCVLSAAVNAAAISPALTGWTNAGVPGASGTAPQAGDLLIIHMTSNAASDTITQTAGTRWAVLDPNRNNGGAIGLATSVWYRIWEGTETAPTWTWASGTRNTYSAVALAPDAGFMIFPDRWGSIKTDTTAATTHTPNAYAITAPFSDCALVFAGSVASASGSTAFTQTASAGFTMPAASSVSNVGTSGQFVYGSNMQYLSLQTAGATPGAETISGGSGAGGTTQATLYSVSVRQLQISAYPFRVIQTAYGFNATSATFAAPVTPGNSVLAILSLANNTTAVPAVSGMTLDGLADNFFAVREASQAGASVNAYYAGIWADLGTAGGQTTVAYAATNNGGLGNSTGMIALEVAGIYPDPVLCTDQKNGATGTGVTAEVTASATTQANEFWIASMGGGAGNNSTSGPNPNGGQVGLHLSVLIEGGSYSLANATGIPDFIANLKSSQAWAAVVATFIAGTRVAPPVLATSASFPAVTVNAGAGIVLGAPPMTVTASEVANPGVGCGLQVMAVTGQAASFRGSIASAALPAGSAITVSITTTVTRSLVFVAGGRNSNATNPVPAAGCTTIGSFSDASNNADYWAIRTTSVTGTPGATTVGDTIVGRGAIAAMEVLAGSGLAIDASTPAYTGVAVASAVTSASFNPPPGALLIALFYGEGLGTTAQQTTLVTDSTGLTWTKQVEQSGTTINGVAAAWTAQAPATGFLAASASFPAVTVSAGSRATPAVLATSASFPAVTVNAGSGVTPALLAVSASFPAVTVSVGTNATATPPVLAVSTAFSAPAVNAGSGVTPSVLATSASFPAVTVQVGSNATATPSVLAASASFAAATVNAGSGVTPALLAASASFAAVTVSAGSVVVPPLLSTSAGPWPVPSVDSIRTTVLATSSGFAAPAVDVIRTSVLATLASFAAPAVAAGSGVTPSVLATSASFAAVTVSASSTAAPAVLAALASFAAPALSTGSAAAPAVLATSATFPAVTIQSGSSATITPPVLGTSAAFAAPVLSTGQTAAPPVLATAASFAAPALSTGQTAAPAVLATAATFAAPVVNAGSGVTTATLTTAAAFAAPAIGAGAGVTPAALTVSASFPAPSAGSIQTTVLATSASFAAPSVDSVRPAALATSATFAAVTVSAGSGVVPAVLSTVSAFSTPSVDFYPAPPFGVAATFAPPAVNSVRPATLAALASFSAPAIGAGSAAAPAVLATSAAFAVPSFRCDQVVTPPVLATAAAFSPPGVTAGGNANAVPAVLATAATFAAPVVSAGEVVTPAALTTPASFAPPAVSAGSGTTPAVLATSASFAAPALHTGQSVTTSALATSASFAAPALHTGQTVTTAALTASASFAAPALHTGQTAAPAVLATSAAFPAVTVQAGSSATAAPPVLACSSAFPAVQVRAGSTASPGVLAASASFAPPVVSAGSAVTPAALAVFAAFAPPVVRISVTASPPLLAGTVLFPLPSIGTTVNATATPACLFCASAFPAAQPHGGAGVQLTGLALAASFPALAVSTGSVVHPASLLALTSFPVLLVNPVSGAITLRASGSMRLAAGTGPDLESLWNAYAVAAVAAQAASDYYEELKIALGTAGLMGRAYSDLWVLDGIAQRAWHEWLMASEHWTRELRTFAAYGGTPPGELAVDSLDT
jgi:hypothetical protein